MPDWNFHYLYLTFFTIFYKFVLSNQNWNYILLQEKLEFILSNKNSNLLFKIKNRIVSCNPNLELIHSNENFQTNYFVMCSNIRVVKFHETLVNEIFS